MGTPGELIKIKLRERSGGEKRGKEKVSRGGEEESVEAGQRMESSV